jgi:hypothetical protein
MDANNLNCGRGYLVVAGGSLMGLGGGLPIHTLGPAVTRCWPALLIAAGANLLGRHVGSRKEHSHGR